MNVLVWCSDRIGPGHIFILFGRPCFILLHASLSGTLNNFRFFFKIAAFAVASSIQKFVAFSAYLPTLGGTDLSSGGVTYSLAVLKVMVRPPPSSFAHTMQPYGEEKGVRVSKPDE